MYHENINLATDWKSNGMGAGANDAYVLSKMAVVVQAGGNSVPGFPESCG